MAKSYKFHGITVTDNDVKIPLANDKRLKLDKYKQFDRSLNLVSMNEQAYRDRLAKKNALAVCTSYSDIERRMFVFNVQRGTKDETERVEISFATAAQTEGHNDLTIENGMVIYVSK